METILIVIHLMIVLALVGVVLLQRSEGGGLGIGGGSGFMTARGAANALTRTTAILAAAFFITSLGLSLLARYGDRPTDILDRTTTEQGTGQGVLDQLGGGASDIPTPAPANAPAETPAPAPSSTDAAPASDVPAAPPANQATQPATDGDATTAPAPATTPVAPAEPQVPN